MATSFINGQALRVYILATAPTDGADIVTADVAATEAIACAKSATLSQSNSVIEVTCQGTADNTAGRRQVIKGEESWSLSVDTLYTTDEDVDSLNIQAAYDAGTPVDILLGGDATGAVYWYGQAIISSLELTATPGELISFNASFEGTGRLYTGTIAAL